MRWHSLSRMRTKLILVSVLLLFAVLLTCFSRLLTTTLSGLPTNIFPISTYETNFLDSFILDGSGQYRIYPKVFRKTGKYESKKEKEVILSLVSHCTADHLTLLPALVERWQGPVSLAIFVDDPVQLNAVLKEFFWLRECDENVKRFVDAHFVTVLSGDDGRLPINSNSGSHETFDMKEKENRCSESGWQTSKLGKQKPANYDHIIRYPNNLLRNIGRKFSTSLYTFVVDIDMLPNRDLYSDFVRFIEEKNKNTKTETETNFQKTQKTENDSAFFSEIEKNKNKNEKTKDDSAFSREVFVVPAFEIDDSPGVFFPETKTELVKLLNRFVVRPFYFSVCWKCQKTTDFQKWSNFLPFDQFFVAYKVEWAEPWEPFFIAKNEAPFFDERFSQYGFNRISQACEIHVAGYNFSVLSNAFLLHRGFKTPKKFHKTKTEELNKNRILYLNFKTELEDVYPESNRSCW